MKMKISDNIIGWLDQRSKQNESYAENSACQYASTDDKKYQEQYRNYSNLAKEISEIRREMVQALHVLESHIPGNGDKEPAQ